MADELIINSSIRYADAEGSKVFRYARDIMPDVATRRFCFSKLSVGTSEEAIPLGEATSPGWAFFFNLDQTNYVELKTSTGGVIFGKMLAGEPAGPIRLGSGAQVPYWIANTAACLCEALIVNT